MAKLFMINFFSHFLSNCVLLPSVNLLWVVSSLICFLLTCLGEHGGKFIFSISLTWLVFFALIIKRFLSCILLFLNGSFDFLLGHLCSVFRKFFCLCPCHHVLEVLVVEVICVFFLLSDFSSLIFFFFKTTSAEGFSCSTIIFKYWSIIEIR